MPSLHSSVPARKNGVYRALTRMNLDWLPAERLSGCTEDSWRRSMPCSLLTNCSSRRAKTHAAQQCRWASNMDEVMTSESQLARSIPQLLKVAAAVAASPTCPMSAARRGACSVRCLPPRRCSHQSAVMVPVARSCFRSAARRRCGGASSLVALSGKERSRCSVLPCGRGGSALAVWPNKCFEFAPVGRRTRKSDALLLAAQAIRSASEERD
jgi:hypothetical protein